MRFGNQLRKMWRGWSSFMDRREPAGALAAFRIAMGVVLIGTVLSVAAVPARWPVWLDAAHGGWISQPGSPVMKMLGASQWTVGAMVVLCVVSALLVTLGFGGRVSAFVALQSWLALADLNGRAGGAYDELIANGLWLLVLSSGTQTASMDAWRRTGQWMPPLSTAPVWGRFLVAFQILLVYGATGLAKVSAHWVPGGDASALYDILQQPTWQRFDASWVASVYPLTQVATTTLWIWEFTAPLWGIAWLASLTNGGGRWTDIRFLYLGIGLGFHMGTECLLEVGAFGFASLAFYPALLHPADWVALRARVFGQR